MYKTTAVLFVYDYETSQKKGRMYTTVKRTRKQACAKFLKHSMESIACLMPSLPYKLVCYCLIIASMQLKEM